MCSRAKVPLPDAAPTRLRCKIGLSRCSPGVGLIYSRSILIASRFPSFIARIVGDRLILEGTTVDEIEKYHQETLMSVPDKVNTDIAALEARQRREQEKRDEQLRQHRPTVEEAVKRIRFD